jgi:hypothetical protein
MGPWKKFESTVVRLKRSYEDTGSEVISCFARFKEFNGEKKTATKTSNV